MLYHAAAFSSLSVSCWEFFFTASQKIDSISELQVAKQLSSDGYVSVRSSPRHIIFFRNMLSNDEDNGPWTSLYYSDCHLKEKSQKFPFNISALVTFSYNDQMTSSNLLLILCSFKTRQRPSCQAQSNAFLMRIKLYRNSC